MGEAAVRLPERRTAVLYSRITPVNKKFLAAMAERRGVSEAALVNHILAMFRKQNVGDRKKSKGDG